MEELATAKRPRAMTAKGTFGATDASATSRLASARAVMSASTLATGAPWRTSRAITPSGWRSFHRLSARWRSGTSSRHSIARRARSTSSTLGSVRSCSAWGSRSTSSTSLQRLGGGGVVPGRQRLRALSNCAERAGELLGPPAVARQVAHVEEAEVGVGALREPAEERQHLLHRKRGAGEPAGQLPHRGSRAQTVGEAEGGEPGLDGPGATSSSSSPRRRLPAAAGSTGARGSTARSPGGVPAPRRAGTGRSRAGVAEAQRAGDPGALGLVGRHGVHLGAVVELEAVLQAPQEPVGLGQLGGVVGIDVARRASSARASSVAGERRSASRRPWTSCSSWTANSTSLMPPRPRFTSRSVNPLRATSASADLEVPERAEVVGAEHP